MNKQKLRVDMRNKRDELSGSFRQKADIAICDAVRSLPVFRDAQSIVAFYPHKGEPDILPFLEYVVDSDKDLYLPRVKDDYLELVRIYDLDDLEQGAFDIPEPGKHLDHAEFKMFDLILVPGLAFSRKGDRVGYGRGFYDRLLKDVDGFSVGVCYDFQLVDELPVEEHDYQIDMVVVNS